jgi:hypothetical protein
MAGQSSSLKQEMQSGLIEHLRGGSNLFRLSANHICDPIAKMVEVQKKKNVWLIEQ